MNPLGQKIRALIEASGPIPVSDFMTLALSDPDYGYYTTRDPIGAAGDFITAPEISQMFGELIGIWSLAVFELLGKPERFHLVELGPGRGTLMADLIRAARLRPSFLQAAEVRLVETSPTLKARQSATLSGIVSPFWHERIEDVPDGPAIVIANEFFDALPIRQLVRMEQHWHERVVGVGDAEDLVFGASADPVDPILVPDHAVLAPPGTVVEIAPAAASIMATVADRVRMQGARCSRSTTVRRNAAWATRCRRSAVTRGRTCSRTPARSISPSTSTSPSWRSWPRRWARPSMARSTRATSCSRSGSSSAPAPSAGTRTTPSATA